MKTPVYEVQHPDGEWLEVTERTFNNFSNVGRRIRYLDVADDRHLQSAKLADRGRRELPQRV